MGPFTSRNFNVEVGVTMEKYICIHGHFYQPPRENAWLEIVELQDSAYPYHDWNKRISAECYATNATSRILDEEGRITEIVSNYKKISFNFGPTLLAWMEKMAPDVYEDILAADAESQKTFSGHGSALAQPYNHVILPLANSRDKFTQILWGIKDFEYRFKRYPEGMWLPETAVDLESLDMMAELGIRFTILAPHQASRIRGKADEPWSDVSGGRIDPRRPYILHLPSGHTISLFFYDGVVSRAVAFERLLDRGDLFAKRLLDAFSDQSEEPQIVHIATDGESYGHHHRHGEMALSYALNHIEKKQLATLTVYGEFLEKHPATFEVEIFENTSWSCPHGINRWKEDCGCQSGAHAEWNQKWRAPLRNALDWLRDALEGGFEHKGGEFLKDPWRARNDYIEVINGRSPESIEAFLLERASRALNPDERIIVIKLLELQRNAMLMYTSCGWFFDELSGIETLQILEYAARTLQLAREALDQDMETEFVQILEEAQSNLSEQGTGRQIFEQRVRPAAFDLQRVAAHFAISALFEDLSRKTSLCSYDSRNEDYQVWESGRFRLAVGRNRVLCGTTGESSVHCFAVLHFGDHNFSCGISEYLDEESYKRMTVSLSETFEKGDLPETLRSLDKHFGISIYSLKSLFRDEQRLILKRILSSTLNEVEMNYRQLFERYAPLMAFLKDSNSPPPKALYGAAELVLNADLRRALEDKDLDMQTVEALIAKTRLMGVSIEEQTLEYVFRKSLEMRALAFTAEPENMNLLKDFVAAVTLASSLPFKTNLWKPQNLCYGVLQSTYQQIKSRAQDNDQWAHEWIEQFTTLAGELSIAIDG
jgi:alpha-amylase/alpha-mannosidase (GH57 family)